MTTRVGFCLSALAALLIAGARKPDGDRLAYLDENDPYAPGLNFPKLTTPQWVGEEGVEAVVVLAIDDMREPARYEAYLRPILDRLKAIDGRAPVSIMTCQVKPDDPQLQRWLNEGLNFDVHTLTHPRPLLQKGNIQAARETYDGCIDLLNRIPGNRPVAFRMPYCDSLNTPSPRFYDALFNASTPEGHFLTIDSSVFNVLTPADPALPKSLVEDPDGQGKFRKYLPFQSFVNTIEDYPYPYVINRLCWEFPCVVPSDWEAQNINKPYSPKTVEDLKAALDAVVIKQGVFNLVFHPHGWIKNQQVVELIDHAVAKHGKKVKFLNFREAQERLDRNLLPGGPLRERRGADNGTRLLDLNNDGYMDVLMGGSEGKGRVWDPGLGAWKTFDSKAPYAQVHDEAVRAGLPRFGVVHPDGRASRWFTGGRAEGRLVGAEDFRGSRWTPDRDLLRGLLDAGKAAPEKGFLTRDSGQDAGVRLRDIDGDGACELIMAGDAKGVRRGLFRYDGERGWVGLPFDLPPGAAFARTRPEGGIEGLGQDDGLRLIDVDEDGALDVVFSNERAYGIYLFDTIETGWTRKVMAGRAGEPGALPPIVRVGGAAWRPHDSEGKPRLPGSEPSYVTDNGFWVHSRHLWWQNEDTDKMPDLVDRRSFDELLRDVPRRGRKTVATPKAFQGMTGF